MSIFNDNLIRLKKSIFDDLQTVSSFEELEKLKIKYLARKGELTLFLKKIKDLPDNEKKEAGKIANQIKQEVENAFKMKEDEFNKLSAQGRSALGGKSEIRYDVTLPGKDQEIGTLHPITQVKNELNDAFKFLGFEIYEGPEVTTEGYAFDNMNFPPDHPARESMDTYWVKGIKGREGEKGLEGKKGMEKLCLRPHLTGASVRYMQNNKPPFRFVYPGRPFRSDNPDASHDRCFNQYEALIVNKDISFSGGKILIRTILERVFGRQVETRMRIGFFPFVEPGFEIDMHCLNCEGKGCPVCKHSGWVEMMPGGPPHPNVLKAGGIDPNEWQGFYINIGLDRLVMMKYGIDDIRLFHSGDLRFLRQF